MLLNPLFKEAVSFCRDNGIRQILIDFDVLSVEGVRQNWDARLAEIGGEAADRAGVAVSHPDELRALGRDGWDVRCEAPPRPWRA